MRETVACGLVVVVLLAAMTSPAVAFQDGPPEHAGGDGPPEHAEGDGDGPPAENGPSHDDGDEADDATDDEDERAGGEDEEDADSGDGGDRGGGGDDAPTTDDSTATDDSSASDDDGVIPTETVTSLLPFDDEDDSTPENSEQAETRTAEDDDSPIPTIDDDEDDPTPTPDGEEGTATPADDGDDSGSSDDGDDSSQSGDGDDSSSSTSSSDGSDDSVGSVGSERDDRPTVETRTDDSATVVEVSGAEAGDTVEADLRGPATDGRGVAVESVAIEVGADGSSTTAVTRPTAESDVESAPGVPVAYFDVESDAAVERATLTLAVDEGALPDGVAPDDLEVLRYQDGEWEPVETTDEGETGVHTVETSGSGTYAVAAPAAGPIEVANVEVIEDGNGSGGERTVRATVENTGDRESTRTVAATVDGETVATREVTLGPGEAATLAFDLPAGDGTVAVGGVEAEQHSAQGTDAGSAPAPASTGGNLAFGVGAAVLVVLAAAGTGLLAARHEDWDWER